MRILNLPDEEQPQEKPVKEPLLAHEGNTIWYNSIKLVWYNIGFNEMMLFYPGSCNRWFDIRVTRGADARPYLEKERPEAIFEQGEA
jgi:hypothetical protein